LNIADQSGFVIEVEVRWPLASLVVEHLLVSKKELNSIIIIWLLAPASINAVVNRTSQPL
jgi:hypothetical protein